MSFFVDPEKTGLENFYDLVAQDNPKAIHIPGRVTLSSPEPSDDEDGLTQVTISAIDGEGYTAPAMTVRYVRVPPVEAAGTQDNNEIQLEDRYYSQSELKSLIISHHNVVAGDVSIVGFGINDTLVIPEWNADPREDLGYGYSVVANQNSYIYQDGLTPYVGKLISGSTTVPLWFAIGEDNLGGFIAP